MKRKLLIGAALVPAVIGLTALAAGAQDGSTRRRP